MPIIQNGQGLEIAVPPGQSIAVASLTGTYSATLLDGAGRGVLASASAGGATYGPYPAGATLRVKAGVDSCVAYDVGASPAAEANVPARFATDMEGNAVGLFGPDGGALTGGGLIFVPPSGDKTGAKDTRALKEAIERCYGTSLGIGLAAGDFYFNDTTTITDGFRSNFEAAKNGADPDNGKMIVPPRFVGAGIWRTRLHMVTPNKPLLWLYGTQDDGLPQMQSPYFEGIGFFGPGFAAGVPMTVAIQFGGESTALKQITADPWFVQCGFFDWHTCVRHDDTTGATYTKCFFQRFRFGVDRGYNSDIYTFNQCAFGDQSLTSMVNATTVNGSTAITTTGSAFANLTTGAVVAGVGIQADTIITKVNANAATLSKPATASGTVEIYTFLGIAVSDVIAGAGSGWVQPNGIVGQSNGVQFNNCWFMRLYSALSAYHPSSSGSVFSTCYTELLYKFVELGVSSDATTPFGLLIQDHHFSQPRSFRNGGVIDVLSSASANHFSATLLRCRTDAASDDELPAVPWINSPLSFNGTASLVWEQNILPVRAGVPSVNHGGTTAVIPIKQRFVVGGGSVENGGYVKTYASATGDLFWDYAGEDQVHITANSAMTINNFGGQNPPKGRELIIILTDSGAGARVITFGSKFLNASGTAIGAFTPSVANKSAVFRFIWDGANFRQTNTAQWA